MVFGSESNHFMDMNRIDGMPTEFEWKIFQESWRWASSRRFKIWWETYSVNLRTSQTGSSSCQMLNDLEWGAKGNKERWEYNSLLADFLTVIFLGAWIRREGTYTNRLDGSWNQSAENMMANFLGSGRPIFRASSASERGERGSKGGGKKSIHFNGSNENIELLLRTVISANQHSIYGATADLCNDAPKGFRVRRKFAGLDRMEKMEWKLLYRPLCRRKL